LAQPFYDLVLTKCGDSWYYITKHPIWGSLRPKPNGDLEYSQFETVIYELKGVSTGVGHRNPTEAEKLEGYEWIGR